jgi:hypothetical protein
MENIMITPKANAEIKVVELVANVDNSVRKDYEIQKHLETVNANGLSNIKQLLVFIFENEKDLNSGKISHDDFLNGCKAIVKEYMVVKKKETKTTITYEVIFRTLNTYMMILSAKIDYKTSKIKYSYKY